MTKTVTSTLTLSGRKFSKKKLIGIQQTIKTFPNPEPDRIGSEYCDYLSWTTAQSRNKHNACLDALEKLEKRSSRVAEQTSAKKAGKQESCLD
ncbi:hypothetical protein [Bathymodiolus platifrons methanotrophic gill symbiont]|uniref:hypothetical protein n=1 Tax=Bathymodiolus platifrons methanotrophic gill symbiont TaxID=113268 RepID=UPI001C8EB1E8|nr:hypothetical protein [Bathymodiolus platifrons methanotrophic gill symbiont]